MPQERSYFAIMLPQGWWIFGVDLALSEDIDTEQYKFFADVAKRRVGKDDAVIIMTHEPYWVLDTSEQRSEDGSTRYEFAERNLRELMATHLKGKVRARIAGDLHHYTRHVPVNQPGAKRAASSPSPPSPAFSSKKASASGPAKTDLASSSAEAPSEGEIAENLPECIVSGGESGGGGARAEGGRDEGREGRGFRREAWRCCLSIVVVIIPSQQLKQLPYLLSHISFLL